MLPRNDRQVRVANRSPDAYRRAGDGAACPEPVPCRGGVVEDDALDVAVLQARRDVEVPERPGVRDDCLLYTSDAADE